MKQQRVPFCCACGKVKDELDPTAGEGQWVDLHSYRMAHGFQVADLSMTKTYCVDCGHLYQMLKSHGASHATPGKKGASRAETVQKREENHHGQ